MGFNSQFRGLMDNLGTCSQNFCSFALFQSVTTSNKPGFDECIILVHRRILFSHLPLQVSLAKFSLKISIILGGGGVSYRRL